MPTPVLDRAQKAEAAKAARREEILDAARRVFAERGFRGTTIADIAEAAGVALGTIYIYFKSKEDVFAALHERFSNLITRVLGEGANGLSLEETVRSRVANLFEMCAANRDLVRLVVLNTDRNSRTTDALRAADEGRFRPLVEAFTVASEGGFIRQSDPCIMTRLTVGLVSIAVYQAFVVEDGRNADKYRDECVAMTIAYLAPSTLADINQTA